MHSWHSIHCLGIGNEFEKPEFFVKNNSDIETMLK